MKNNIVLIGMPGVGKSTIGVVLAKNLGYHFLDSDIVIQQQTGKLLHEIITEKGLDGFLQTEDEINASIEAEIYHNLSASWRTRKASGIAAVQVQRPKNQEPMSKGRRRQMSQLKKEQLHPSSAF